MAFVHPIHLGLGRLRRANEVCYKLDDMTAALFRAQRHPDEWARLTERGAVLRRRRARVQAYAARLVKGLAILVE